MIQQIGVIQIFLNKCVLSIILTFFILVNKGFAKISLTNWNEAIQQTVTLCNSVSHLSIPDKDRPDELVSKELIGCDPSKYYNKYELGSDYKKARYCAIVTYDDGVLAYPDGFTTNSNKVLTMIYANGKGVPKNIDLAIHFACDYKIITAEKIRVIARLIQIKEDGKDFEISNYFDEMIESQMKINILEEAFDKYEDNLYL